MQNRKISSFIPSVFLFLTLFSLLNLCGCQKSPVNGDLDGQWQVMSVEPAPVAPVITERLYYCFNLHTCMLTYYGGVAATGNMTFSGDKLSLDFPFFSEPEYAERLSCYGIDSNPTVFDVVRLNKNNLIIRSSSATITMRKF